MGIIKKIIKTIAYVFLIYIVIVIIAAIIGAFMFGMDGDDQSITPSMTIEEIKSNASAISYDDLMRYNDVYVGDIIYNRGEILQVSERRTDTYILRVATKQSTYGYHDDVIYVNYKGNRLLEGDIIDIWGKSKGLKTYEAILGNQITIPEIDSLYVARIT
jgi:hypothetical protein